MFPGSYTAVLAELRLKALRQPWRRSPTPKSSAQVNAAIRILPGFALIRLLVEVLIKFKINAWMIAALLMEIRCYLSVTYRCNIIRLATTSRSAVTRALSLCRDCNKDSHSSFMSQHHLAEKHSHIPRMLIAPARNLPH